MATIKKSIRPERLHANVVKSTMKTMSIEGRLPKSEPRVVGRSSKSGDFISVIKSPARHPLG